MAALTRVKSKGLGHIALGDGGRSETATSGNVGNDGRVRVRFHENPQKLAHWLRDFEGAFRPHSGDYDEEFEQARLRRRSSVILQNLQQHPPSKSPRLNIAIHIVGSRGDVQPFIPIAQLLMKEPYGHRVRICTHPVFKDFVESNGVEFFSIGGDPEALMAYMVKNPGLLPSRESVKAGDIKQRRKEMAEIINGAWRSCIEAGDGMGERTTAATVLNADDLFVADAIIANPPSMAHIHCAEKLGIPLHMVFTMPWCPTQAFHHPLASMSYGEADTSAANYLSFIMMELLTWQGLGDLINKFRTQTLGLDHISPLWGCQLLPRLRVPYTFLWSESLIPKPADWDSHINITSFSFLPLADKYTPPADLTAFLEAGPPPIYIGFGSIVVDDPKALTQLIFKAVEQAGVRAIVSKGWGGVGGGDDVPDNVYLIGNCPHDWLFKRVSAVVHHGGAGTSAAGIACGRPTVVVPFFGDQPFWGQMIACAGAGPAPVPFKEMTAETLAASITFALKPEVQVAVQQMAERIAEEDGAGDTARDIQERLALDTMRCDICPERLANWRHRKTGAHLSNFAVGCLVDKGYMKPHDFKLLKHKHWYVDEGAEHPLIGLVAAVSGFFTNIGVATSDYSHRLKHPPQAAQNRMHAVDLEAQRPAHEKQPEEESNTTREPSAEPSEGPDVQPGQEGKAEDGEDGHLKRVAKAHSMTPKQMNAIAMKMATKSLQCADPAVEIAMMDANNVDERGRRKSSVATLVKKRNRPTEIARATGRYGIELVKAGLKAPVAVCYNVANGFHNYPSYGFIGHEVRRRDQITGLGSGLRTSGKEFVLGTWEAFSGVVVKPYEGAKREGVKGFGKGIYQAGRGFTFNLFAAIFGLPGYTLKGIEKEFSKHRLTALKAEVLLIRLRQGIDDFRRSTEAERNEPYTLGIHLGRPQVSWRFSNAPSKFNLGGWEVKIQKPDGSHSVISAPSNSHGFSSSSAEWPEDIVIQSRQTFSIEIRAKDENATDFSPWSEPFSFETGLLVRSDWTGNLISAPWAEDSKSGPQPEDLFRKVFEAKNKVRSARLYATAQGVYEAEINGQRIGDYFLAPGWTAYDARLQYQTYDVTAHIASNASNCIAIRLAEGWFNGRIGFEGGKRSIWGTRTAALAQLEITYEDGSTETVVTDDSWTTTRGPIKLAEIYDGEKYDATAEIPGWSLSNSPSGVWETVQVLPQLPETTNLICGYGEPVKRLEYVKPLEFITTPSGKSILDFGQNLVGFIRINNVKGQRGSQITLLHAEVLEKEELGTRPLRDCKAEDVYTLKGDESGETWEPRFSFHGFRYVQVDGWPSTAPDLKDAIEACVCHTDMEEVGNFTCSDNDLNKLYSNVRWSMRGNFLSVPTDCPQRDERLGWTGDLALFAPTATFIYNCFGILKNWLADVAHDQKVLDGVPPMVCPNVLIGQKNWSKIGANAIWHDVVILAPWALYEESADLGILRDQYESMKTWIDVIPRNETGSTHLWDFNLFQLGDWLDPNAPPDEPMKAVTDPPLVANAFLVRSLDLITKIAALLSQPKDIERYQKEADAARREFQDEYVSSNGRLTSDSQTAYALAICFDLISENQAARAGSRLAEIRRSLRDAPQPQVSFLAVPRRHGATTVWERWDSMLPDGTINPGDMTSFNHYAFGAVAKFLVERLAGLQRLEPGWKRSRAKPILGAELTNASAEHVTPYGKVACAWKLADEGEGRLRLKVNVVVPPLTEMEVVLPTKDGKRVEMVGSGEWTFETEYERKYEWPVKELSLFPQ
ncbi:glycosyltransferase family 28 domain-containing protein [Colletotrichum scovillei]|uniref:alpha-L-rhamnosidase n=1 Tax=Colletotrichum scovillei TaxID=1209932 RepID=A0A9P7QUK4_9PEZI|nr:glycosyltransferase family 28 domain-containing protein [Colletotrichum scovillei]